MIQNIKYKIILLKKNRLFANFFSLSVLQIFTYILPFLTIPYLVRVLGIEIFGLVAFAAAFIAFFSILVDYGFNLSATREVSIYRENEDKIIEIYSSVITIKVLLTLFSFILLSFIVFIFDKFNSHIELYFITFLVVIGQALFPIWYFQGMEKMKYITIVNIFSKTLFTVAIFIFVNSEADYLLVPLLIGFGSLFGSLYSLYIIKRDFKQKFLFQSLGTLKKYFMDSSIFFLSRVSESIYTVINAFILGLYTNNTMVGYYSIAEKLYQAIQAIYGPINQALYPYVAKERNIKLFKKISYLVFLLNIFIVIGLYYFGIQLFDILFADKVSQESISVFNIFLISSIIIVISNLIGYPFLAALGFAKEVNLGVFYGAIFHLSGLLILVVSQNITIYSVASMVIFTEFLVLSLRIFWIRKNRLWKI